MSVPASEISSTPATPAATKDDANESSLRELARQYRLEEEPAESSEPAETQSGDEPRKGKPKTLTELAERLGVEVKDLYDLEIPSDKLKGLTLGKLKDHMAEREAFTTRSLKFEEDAAQKDADFSRGQLELQTLIQALPKEAITPQLREAVRQKHEAALSVERKRTLDAIPEWRDESRRTEELTAMVEYLTGFGFPTGYLAQVNDHRALKFIRTAWQREQRLRKALELVSEQKPNALGKSKDAARGKPASARPLSREEREVKRYLGVFNKQ
jgi:hypothetical protein